MSLAVATTWRTWENQRQCREPYTTTVPLMVPSIWGFTIHSHVIYRTIADWHIWCEATNDTSLLKWFSDNTTRHTGSADTKLDHRSWNCLLSSLRFLQLPTPLLYSLSVLEHLLESLSMIQLLNCKIMNPHRITIVSSFTHICSTLMWLLQNRQCSLSPTTSYRNWEEMGRTEQENVWEWIFAWGGGFWGRS